MYTHANDDIFLFTLGNQQRSFLGVSMSLQLVVMVNTVNTVKIPQKIPMIFAPTQLGGIPKFLKKFAETPSPWLPQHPGYSSLALWPWVHKVNHHGSPQLGKPYKSRLGFQSYRIESDLNCIQPFLRNRTFWSFSIWMTFQQKIWVLATKLPKAAPVVSESQPIITSLECMVPERKSCAITLVPHSWMAKGLCT